MDSRPMQKGCALEEHGKKLGVDGPPLPDIFVFFALWRFI